MRNQSAFTLIELLTVIAIVGVLAGISVPAASFWLDRSKVISATGNLKEAIGYAKGAAVRNFGVASSGVPVSAVCISETNELRVLEGTTTDAPDCTSTTMTALWSTRMNSDVEVTDNGEAVQCLCFNSTAILTTNQCSSCQADPVVSIGVDELNENLYIF